MVYLRRFDKVRPLFKSSVRFTQAWYYDCLNSLRNVEAALRCKRLSESVCCIRDDGTPEVIRVTPAATVHDLFHFLALPATVAPQK